MRTSFQKSLVILIIVLLAIFGFYWFRDGDIEVDDFNQTNSNTNTESPLRDDSPQSLDEEIPAEYKLSVPFTAQAPTGNWDELHNEACEEASAIMANGYFNSVASLSPAQVEQEIQRLTEWQKTNLGYNLSITTEETVELIKANYDLKAELAEISESTIKKALSEDKLVIVPAQGQMLDNPNFTPPGPKYHMFVITGYDSTHFITNDPGTRNGLDYRYTYSTISAATGNYSHETEAMDLTDKKIIIVSKK